MSEESLTRLLESFGAAWNRHDIEALMACMHDDCVFEAVAGPDACGARHQGPQAVRKAFESAWLTIPDAQWRNPRVWVKGEQGVVESTFTGTAADGAHIEANMVDLITFRDGKILRKNAFRKNRPPMRRTA
ncbi:MAG: nuclear transport factor 2 family protein [Candidimonas sp.]|nr:MAG: nuclear transport factor 2 family protein [Candidimonas sp.]